MNVLKCYKFAATRIIQFSFAVWQIKSIEFAVLFSGLTLRLFCFYIVVNRSLPRISCRDLLWMHLCTLLQKRRLSTN